MSTEIRIDRSELQALAGSFKRGPNIVVEEIATMLTRAKLGIKAAWVRKGLARPFPRYTGEYAGSIHEQTSTIRLSGELLEFRGDVLASAAHAGIVDEGRPAGTFPDYTDRKARQPLERWVHLRARRGEISLDVEAMAPKQKLVPISGATSKQGKRAARAASRQQMFFLSRRSASERRDAAVRNLAFLIGRKVHEKGTTGYELADKTVAEVSPAIDAEMRRMADRIVTRITGGA